MLCRTQGEPGRPSVRVGTSIIDMGTGMWTVIGVLTALLRRQTTGKGSVVDLSLYETALGWMVYFLPMFAMSGRLPVEGGFGCGDDLALPGVPARATANSSSVPATTICFASFQTFSDIRNGPTTRALPTMDCVSRTSPR